MAETRSQTMMKKAAARGVEESLGSRIDYMLERTQQLEATVADQNAKIIDQNSKMDKNIADMFEAIRLIQGSNHHASTSNEHHMGRGSPVVSHTPIMNHGGNDMARGRSGNPYNYACLTRMAKLDFSRFDGERFKEWLSKVEQLFVMDNTHEELKVGLASIHFDGLASTWHQAVIQSDEGNAILHDWPFYKVLLKERFEEVLDDPIAELKALQETDGIVDYHGKFELIRTRVKLSEEYLVSAYLAGLRVDT